MYNSVLVRSLVESIPDVLLFGYAACSHNFVVTLNLSSPMPDQVCRIC